MEVSLPKTAKKIYAEPHELISGKVMHYNPL